jgi:hypothetical protein
MKSCIIFTSQKIMEDELGGPCSMHGRDDKYIQNFNQEKLKERRHLEVLRVDGVINLEYIYKLRRPGRYGLDSSGLDRGHWSAFLNTRMALCIP